MNANKDKLMPVLAGIHLVALPLYPQMPSLILLLIGLFTIWTLLIIFKRVTQPRQYVRIFLAVIVVASLIASYGTIFGQDPGTSMVIMLCFLKLFEMKNKRDVIVVIFLGYFLTASNFFHTQSLWIAVYVFVVVIYLTSLLIIFSDRLGTTNSSGRIRASTRMIMQAAPLMLILFILFPRFPGPLWGLPEDALSSTTGISEEMSPGSINRLISSGDVAFRVKFVGRPPHHQSLYWRGLVLSHYDGRKWTRDDAPTYTRPEVFYFKDQEIDTFDYTVTLEPHNQKWLYTLEQIINHENNFGVSRELQTFAKNKINNVMSYSMRSNLQAVSAGLYDPERRKNLTLPSGMNEKTRVLAEQFRFMAGGEDKELINLVLSYFREQEFFYTLSPPLLGVDAMDDFLFGTRRGFCEHYASAFVHIMRAAGIPARIVVGYQGGTINPVDDYMIVRQSDAHAWTEVWLDNKAWIRVDPTAAVSPERIELGIQNSGLEPKLLPSFFISNYAHLMQARYILDSFQNSWNQWVVGFNNKKQKELFEKLGIDDVSAASLISWLVVAMSLGGGLVALWVFRRYPNKKKDIARYYYDVFCCKLKKAGLEKRPHEGPKEYLARISISLPNAKPASAIITGEYMDLRYGCSAGKDQEKRFIRFVRRFRVKKTPDLRVH